MITRKVLYNIPGWRTKRHLVVFESDDWGSIRMPSRIVYEEFLKRGIRVDLDPYCRYDSIASPTDLQNLFEILHSVKDKNGNPAVITANALMANPNFEGIKDSDFQCYSFEPFTKTIADRFGESTFGIWKQGMSEHVFRPQFHGREHVNIKKWLAVLQKGESVTRTAFDLGTWGLTQIADPSIKEYYMSAFCSGLDQDIEQYNAILAEGLDMFRGIFGFSSDSFIATTYEWSPKIEPGLKSNGIKYIQGAITQKIPIDDDHIVRVRYNGFQGTRTKNGLIRLFRNCFFEPSTNPNRDFVSDCLHRIDIAFKWHKAANICTHRLNFIGSIDHANTDRNLPLFKKLLFEIVKQWPDVEFVSSDQLGRIIEGTRYPD